MFLLWRFWFLHVITSVQWFSKKIKIIAPYPPMDFINMMEELCEKMVHLHMIGWLVHFLEIQLFSRQKQEIDFCNVCRVLDKGWGCQSYKWFKCYPFHFRQYHQSQQKLTGNILWLSWFNVPNWSPQFLLKCLIAYVIKFLIKQSKRTYKNMGWRWWKQCC